MGSSGEEIMRQREADMRARKTTESTDRLRGQEPLCGTMKRLKPPGKIRERRKEGSLAERKMTGFNG